MLQKMQQVTHDHPQNLVPNNAGQRSGGHGGCQRPWWLR